jgi:hypothetical protein
MPKLIYLTIFSCFLLTHSAFAQTEQKIAPTNGASSDELGRSVCVRGDVAIAGATLDSETNPNQGSAYVFRFDGVNWVEEQKLIAPDGMTDDNFGKSVAIEGDFAVVGAPLTDDNGTNSGSVYFYKFDGTTWNFEQKIFPNIPALGDEFGLAVSLDNGKLLIGAPKEDGSVTNNRGAAYFFSYNGSIWVEDQKVFYGFSSNDDFFGYSVDLDDDRAVVSAYLDDDNGVNSGSAFVYDFDGSTWIETQKLIASNGATGDAFGFSVSVEDDKIACGAYANSTKGLGTGAVYIFELAGTWTEDTILYASDFNLDDWFGYSLEMDSTSLAIGSFHNDDLGAESGSCYFFRHTGTDWIEEFNLLSSDGVLGDEYGFDVSVDGMQLLVGSPMDDDNGTNSGSLYFYPLCTYAPTQEICMASVLQGTDDNIILWRKPVTTFIEDFTVYSNGADVSTQSYSGPSEYIHNVNAGIGYKNYHVSTTNYCGIESDTMNVHKTIHLTGTLGGGNSHVLSWDEYIGFPYNYHRIWRDTTGTGSNFHLIFATLASQFTYTDNYISQAGNSYYIEVEKGSNCNSGSSLQSSSYSNTFDFNQLSSQEINDLDFQVIALQGQNEIKVNTNEPGLTIELLDLSGKLIQRKQSLGEPIQFSGVKPGMYLLTVSSRRSRSSVKLVLQ